MTADVSSNPVRTARTRSSPRQRGRRHQQRRDVWTLLLFATPALAVVLGLGLGPLAASLQYSLTDWDGFSSTFSYVGFDNYRRALTADRLFTNALVNNVQFMILVVLAQVTLALMLALALHRQTRFAASLRGLFFVPVVLSSVAVAFAWRFIFDPTFGPLNRVLDAVGLDSWNSAYLGEPAAAIPLLALVQVWSHAGQLMIIFIAGLQQLPVELYEAAALDGASSSQQFRHLTWPLLAPTTALVVAYTTVQTFKSFDLVLGLGGNPPRPELDILTTRIYRSFGDGQFAYAAAESVILLLVVAAVTALQRRLLPKGA